MCIRDSYYIDYYGKTFKHEVDKLRIEVDNLQQQLNDKNIQLDYLLVERDKESGADSVFNNISDISSNMTDFSEN